jgi:hypothetical protein
LSRQIPKIFAARQNKTVNWSCLCREIKKFRCAAKQNAVNLSCFCWFFFTSHLDISRFRSCRKKSPGDFNSAQCPLSQIVKEPIKVHRFIFERAFKTQNVKFTKVVQNFGLA